VKLTLTEPDTASMTSNEYAQAVDALASLIVSWLRRRVDTPSNGGSEADQ